MIIDILIFVFCGVLSGFLSGLLGLGGGLVIVPLLMIIFEFTNEIPHEYIMHVVAGTSVSAAVFTSFSSALAQTKRKNVLWSIVKTMWVFTVIGAALGALLTSYLSTNFMKMMLIVFLLLMGTQMFFGFYPNKTIRTFSNNFYRLSGFIIGCFSSVVGSSGGSIFVPFINYTTGNIYNAIGTSPALAWSLALFAGIGYIISGYSIPNLPETTFGYIHIPALICIASTSIFIAPLGVKLSHLMPVVLLKKIFALFLYISALRAIISLFV